MASHQTIKDPPAEISPLEGLVDTPVYHFTGITLLRNHVRLLSAKLEASHPNQQYLVFWDVTKDHLAQIDCQRAIIGKHTRLTHYTDIGLLIVKLIPSRKHEKAPISLGIKLILALARMGLPDDSLCPLGTATFYCPTSSKQPDASFIPNSRNSNVDWPTIVFECGVSESLTQLRIDADWWLTNSPSQGKVQIVIIISINTRERSIRIEKWCLTPPFVPRNATRANPNGNNPVPIPTNMQVIVITENPTAPPQAPTYTIIGAPLVLEFDKLLLRAPVPPEGNVVFAAPQLSEWARRIWY